MNAESHVESHVEFARRLDRRQYRAELLPAEEAAAKSSCLLVAFGASDDLLELRGFVDDEIGAYNGGSCCVSARGLCPMWRNGERKTLEEAREYFSRVHRVDQPMIRVQATWNDGEDGPCWEITTDARRSSPFMILDGTDEYCRGLVIDCSELSAN